MTAVEAHFKPIKKSGDKILEAAAEWGHGADDVWWAKLPDDALGRAGGPSGAGLTADYAGICEDVNGELREGGRTLGKAAAAMWKVAKAYKNADAEARKQVLEARGFDPNKVPKGYW